MKITFILPMILVCGGVRSTFELANQLVDRGHDVSIVYPLIPSSDKRFNTKTYADMAIGTVLNIKNGNNVKWFDLKAKLIRSFNLSERSIPQGDIIIATSWRNAFKVNEYSLNKGEKFYFIRGYETWDGDPELVKKTYNLPLHKIVTSNWLKKIVENKHKVRINNIIPNGVNFNHFYLERDDFNRSIPILYWYDVQ